MLNENQLQHIWARGGKLEGAGGKVKLFIPTVYKKIFMNFMVEFAKPVEICVGFSLIIIDFLQKRLIYIDCDRKSGKQNMF